MFNRHSEWSEHGLTIKAVKAEHSDLSAIGVIICDEGRNYYVTGDTLYNTEIFQDLPEQIDYIFLPVNGKGNNMNMADAARFAEDAQAKTTVPLHVGMFDDMSARDFECRNKLVLKVYEETELQ